MKGFFHRRLNINKSYSQDSSLRKILEKRWKTCYREVWSILIKRISFLSVFFLSSCMSKKTLKSHLINFPSKGVSGTFESQLSMALVSPWWCNLDEYLKPNINKAEMRKSFWQQSAWRHLRAIKILIQSTSWLMVEGKVRRIWKKDS